MSGSIKDRRKYQRVVVEPAEQSLKLTIVDHGATQLFDMSYEGAALAQPKTKKVASVDDTIDLHLQTDIDEATIPCRAIRVNEQVIAVKFNRISAEARVIIDRVVTDRIVGLNMALIDPKHYSIRADFDFWFHGPKDTNLYLWLENDKLVKAHLEMANAALIYEEDSFLFENKTSMVGLGSLNNHQISKKAWAIVEQMSSEMPALIEFKSIVKDHVS